MTTPANPPADLVAFIRAQLDEDERVARRAGGIRDLEWTYDRETFHVISGRGQSIAARKPEGNPINDVDGEHIARHDPARVLAEVDAKRRILDAWEHALKYDGVVKFGGWESCIDMCPEAVLDNVVKLLALPFAGRPGFREEWKPT